jgi:hypothetical protein
VQAQEQPLVIDTFGILSVIADATVTAGHTYAPKEIIDQLPLTTVLFDAAVRNSQNEVAVKATEEGIKYVQAVRAERANQIAPVSAAPGWGEPAPAFANQPANFGIGSVGNSAAPTVASQEAAVGPVVYEYAVETVMEIPKPNRQFVGTRYPFALLGIAPAPNTFFVPATAENINPKKRLQSSVNAANQANKASGKKFIVRDGTDTKGNKGARVYRIA